MAKKDPLEKALVQLHEAFADVQATMSADAAGWIPIGGGTDGTLPGAVRRMKSEEAELAVAINPLIKRGMSLRMAYIWGMGVEVSIKDKKDNGQDVGVILARFWDDKRNHTLCSTDGQLELEGRLGTSGEVWLALPTTEKPGRVVVRPLNHNEITDIITNPEDRYTDWFYLREYTTSDRKPVKELYPALGYWPAVREPAVTEELAKKLNRTGLPAGTPIRWDAPVRKVMVNKLGNRGLGDTFASIPWAVAYKRFLEAWFKLMQALAKFAWQAKTRGDKGADVAKRIKAAMAVAEDAGRTAVMDAGTKLEAISRSGATFDADSGRPLAGMAAAGLGFPVTMLLADPGVTGARAVAETLDEPTGLEMTLRRKLWTRVFQDVVDWVIDSAVRANVLAGTIVRDGDTELVTLPEDDGRTVDVAWPDYDSTSVKDAIDAASTAQGMDLIQPLVLAKYLLEKLKISDIDEVLDSITDDHGNFVPLDILDAKVRANQAANSGSDQ